jgi:Response regulator receiver domain
LADTERDMRRGAQPRETHRAARAAQARSSGNSTVNVEPFPGRASTRTSPPCAALTLVVWGVFAGSPEDGPMAASLPEERAGAKLSRVVTGNSLEGFRGPVTTKPVVMSPSNLATKSGGAGPVLVVEDDPDIRQAIAELLQDEGYDCLLAEHGADALETLVRQTPSLLLVDL